MPENHLQLFNDLNDSDLRTERKFQALIHIFKMRTRRS